MRLFIAALLVAISYAQTAQDLGYWYNANGYDRYIEARNNCEWSEEISAPEFFGESFHYTSSDAFTNWWYDAGRSNLRVKECHMPDLDRPGNFWVIRKIGPFNTTGGAGDAHEWHQIKWDETISKRWFTGRFMARVDEDGNVFGSPPLHVHHEHVSYSESNLDWLRSRPEVLKRIDVGRLAISHGDQYAKQEDGGHRVQFFKSLPEGYGKRMGPRFWYDSKVGDLRVKGSPEIQWYNEVAYRYTLKKPKKELLHMSRAAVASFFDTLRFRIKKDEASIHWHSFRLPTSGEFETIWAHNHGAERIIVFKGDPQKFALGKFYKQPNSWTPLVIDDTDEVASELISTAQSAGIDFCEGKIQWETEPYPNVTNSIHLRQFQIDCKPWKFEKGDVAVIVGLYDPRRSPETNLAQHLLFRGEYVATDRNAADVDPTLYTNNLQICGENPDECVVSLGLGYKIFAMVLKGGMVVPYTPFREAIGWLTLVIMILLLVLGFYFLSSLIWRDLFAKRINLHSRLKQRDVELPFFDSSRVVSSEV